MRALQPAVIAEGVIDASLWDSCTARPLSGQPAGRLLGLLRCERAEDCPGAPTTLPSALPCSSMATALCQLL